MTGRLPALLLAAASLVHAERLTINEALDATERLNPDLQVAKLRIVEAESQSAIVRSAYQPQAQLSVNTAYQTSNLQGIGLVFPGFPSRIGPYRTFNARPAVTQTVVDLSLLESIRAARVREGQQKFNADAVREDLQLAVAQLYLQALQAESRREAAAARVKTADAILTQSRDRQTAGAGSRLDVVRGVQQLEAERSVLIAAEREVAVLKSLLVRAIGRDQSSAADVELVKPAASSVSVDGNGEARPEQKALETGLAAAKLDLKAAERQRWPKVSAFGDWGVLGAGPDRAIGTYNAGVAMTLPLWTGRRIESEIAQASTRIAIAQRQIDRLKLQVSQEVRQAQIEGEEAVRQRQSAEAGTSAAREALELSRLRVEAGLATTVDIAVAQSAFAEADDRLIRSQYAEQLASVRLAWASGEVRRAFR